MRKTAALLGSALFFLIAPVTVGFVVPWWIAGWQMGLSTPESNLFRVAGVALVVLGLVPLIESFGRFALVGLGTPAPVAPTQHLVVTGFYRYVRNPMYLGVLAIILGNALILETGAVFAYAALSRSASQRSSWATKSRLCAASSALNTKQFCRNVPRWIPRLTPWTPAKKE